MVDGQWATLSCLFECSELDRWSFRGSVSGIITKTNHRSCVGTGLFLETTSEAKKSVKKPPMIDRPTRRKVGLMDGLPVKLDSNDGQRWPRWKSLKAPTIKYRGLWPEVAAVREHLICTEPSLMQPSSPYIFVTDAKNHTGSIRKRLFLEINKIFGHAKVTRSFSQEMEFC